MTSKSGFWTLLFYAMKMVDGWKPVSAWKRNVFSDNLGQKTKIKSTKDSTQTKIYLGLLKLYAISLIVFQDFKYHVKWQSLWFFGINYAWKITEYVTNQIIQLLTETFEAGIFLSSPT